MQTASVAADRLISFATVTDKTSLGKSSIYELVAAGHLHPIKLGRKTTFSEAEVDGLVRERIANSATPLKLRTTKPNEIAARGR